MTDKKHDEITGVETTGHSWDGIEELNNPLPRWWLYTWYITIAFSVVYMIWMPSLPALPGQKTNLPGLSNSSDREAVEQAVAEASTARVENSLGLLEADLETIERDRTMQQFALALGESLFGDNCATCHGAGGRGAKGYPSLADDVWIWAGDLDGIEYTIRHGIRSPLDFDTRFSEMPRFGVEAYLDYTQIDDLTEYVLSLSGRAEDDAAVTRAAEDYQQQCASCHGVEGRGDRLVGAPNLTDVEWLHGGSREDIFETIYNARNAHMPAWQDRLDDASIKALAVYVHTLGGGE